MLVIGRYSVGVTCEVQLTNVSGVELAYIAVLRMKWLEALEISLESTFFRLGNTGETFLAML